MSWYVTDAITYLVLGRDVDNAIGVDVKGHFDLRQAARRWRNSLQLKLAQHLVVRSHLALSLQHLDADLHNGGRCLLTFIKESCSTALGAVYTKSSPI